MDEIELIPKAGARYNTQTGGFDAGADPDGFMSVKLGEAAELLQTPLGPPVDETNQLLKTLRAREARNRLAMDAALESDPDYIFFNAVAGACGYHSIGDISTQINTATQLLPGSETITPVKVQGAPATSTQPKVVVFNGVDQATVGARFKINADVMKAIRLANDIISRGSRLKQVPQWAKTSERDYARLARALKESESTLATYLQLVGGLYATGKVANPRSYIPQVSVAQAEKQTEVAARIFSTNVRWAANATEAAREGDLIMESDATAATQAALKPASAMELYQRYRQ